MRLALEEVVERGDDVLEPYARASGPIVLRPVGVARPRRVDDVRRLVRWATREGVPLVPRGAGTGMPGGNVGRGVVVDLTGMDSVGATWVRDGRLEMRVGAGAVAEDVEQAARSRGFHVPALPSSADRCTIGGMVANNAAGVRSFRFGSIRSWVRELEVVTADAEVHQLTRGSTPDAFDQVVRDGAAAFAGFADAWPATRKNSSGYALDRVARDGPLDLFVGSEGTLGIVTSVTLAFEPVPDARGLALIALREPGDLHHWTGVADQVGASACELIGGRLIEMAGLRADPDLAPLTEAATGLLLVEISGQVEEVRAGLDGLAAGARRGPDVLVRTSPDRQAELWGLRKRASPTIAEAAARGLKSLQFIEDCVVPRERLATFLRALEGILAEEAMDAVVFGHAGDGNPHVNPLVDVTGADARDSVERVLSRTADLVAALGGTLSGEHGDGRVRAPLLRTVWGGPIHDAFRSLQETLDPRGILNPGVVIALEGQDPLDGLDLSLTP